MAAAPRLCGVAIARWGTRDSSAGEGSTRTGSAKRAQRKRMASRDGMLYVASKDLLFLNRIEELLEHYFFFLKIP